MIWILVTACLCHYLYTKCKYKNWKFQIPFHENNNYDLKFPYLQNVYVLDEFYPLVVFKEKTLFVSEANSKYKIPTIKWEELD